MPDGVLRCDVGAISRSRAEGRAHADPGVALGLPLDHRRVAGASASAISSQKCSSVLGVDDYTKRTYFAPGGGVGLYIGYHASQRQGATIHSPLNCLPGAGWIPVSRRR